MRVASPARQLYRPGRACHPPLLFDGAQHLHLSAGQPRTEHQPALPVRQRRPDALRCRSPQRRRWICAEHPWMSPSHGLVRLDIAVRRSNDLFRQSSKDVFRQRRSGRTSAPPPPDSSECGGVAEQVEGALQQCLDAGPRRRRPCPGRQRSSTRNRVPVSQDPGRRRPVQVPHLVEAVWRQSGAVCAGVGSRCGAAITAPISALPVCEIS